MRQGSRSVAIPVEVYPGRPTFARFNDLWYTRERFLNPDQSVEQHCLLSASDMAFQPRDTTGPSLRRCSMIEQSHRLPSSLSDLDALQRRANKHRSDHTRGAHPAQNHWQYLRTSVSSPARSISRLPARFLLHGVVALIVPLAIGLSQLHPGMVSPTVLQSSAPSNTAAMIPMVPLSLDNQQFVGDPPLQDNGQIPVPLSMISRAAALAPVVIDATIAGDRVILRNGPGTAYDAVGHLNAGAPIQVIGHHGDWYQVRQQAGQPVYWISGELLNLPDQAIYSLFDVQDKDIPALPPAKIGVVNQDGLQVRDGPGTNYAALAKINSGTQLSLIEIYQGWLHVSLQGGNDGWVKQDFLNVDSAVQQRLPIAQSIPDPNPSLIAAINDNNVNFRQGPDSKYPKLGSLNDGQQVTLLGKYNDWFKVQLGDGTRAWIFTDFLNASVRAVRRIPVISDFPGLPSRPVVQAARSGGGGAGSGGFSNASSNLYNIVASGDVASFAAQFAGYRYAWGGAGPGGFDCSGLTMYVYSRFGIHLPHNAAAQFNPGYGASVGSMSNLAPGDLV